jgi:hypothetical protein
MPQPSNELDVVGKVVNAVDGWLAAGGGVGAAHTVSVDPGLQARSQAALERTAAHTPIPPAGSGCSVQPAVRLRPIVRGARTAYAGVGQRRPEQPAAVSDPVSASAQWTVTP